LIDRVIDAGHVLHVRVAAQELDGLDQWPGDVDFGVIALGLEQLRNGSFQRLLEPLPFVGELFQYLDGEDFEHQHIASQLSPRVRQIAHLVDEPGSLGVG